MRACEKLGTPNPPIDAEIMLAMFLRYEYLLLLNPEEVNEIELRRRILVSLRMVLGKA
jgi:hypothetical protein